MGHVSVIPYLKDNFNINAKSLCDNFSKDEILSARDKSSEFINNVTSVLDYKYSKLLNKVTKTNMSWFNALYSFRARYQINSIIIFIDSLKKISIQHKKANLFIYNYYFNEYFNTDFNIGNLLEVVEHDFNYKIIQYNYKPKSEFESIIKKIK